MSYPEGCQNCGLYALNKSWKQNPLLSLQHLRPNEYDLPGVMIMLPCPDDQKGWDNDDKPSRFLRRTINCLEVPWTITGALRCQLRGKADKLQINNCTSQFLSQEITNPNFMEVGCIVGCGEQALRALFPHSTISLDSARQGILYYPVEYEGASYDIPTIFTNHPAVHFSPDSGKDLRREYQSVFRIAERFCQGSFPNFPEFRYEVFFNKASFFSWACKKNFDSSAVRYHVLDIEQAFNENNPDRPTCLHPGAFIITIQYSWRNPEDNELCIAVVDTSRWNNREVFEFVLESCAGKNLGGSNILQYDIPALASRGGLHPKFGRLLWKTFERVLDSYIFSTCMDLETTGNGLKDQVWFRFRVPSWDTELKLWDKSDEAKALKKQVNRPLDYADYPREWFYDYAALDAYWNLLILEDFPEIHDENHVSRPYYDLQVRGAHVATIFSLTGIPVNSPLSKERGEAQTEKKEGLQQWLNSHPFSQLTGKDVVNTNSGPQAHALLDVLKQMDPDVNKIAYKTTPSGMWQLDDKAVAGKKGTLSLLADLPTGIGTFFKVYKQVRDIVNDTSKILMPYNKGWLVDPEHYPVPHYRVYPTWKVVKYSSDGTDAGRWASKPGMQNTKDDELILELLTGYEGGTWDTGWCVAV